MATKPILLVKFPNSYNINGNYVNVFKSDYQLRQIEKAIEFKVKGDYYVIITPSKKDIIEYEILSLNKETKELDLDAIKKQIHDLLKI